VLLFKDLGADKATFLAPGCQESVMTKEDGCLTISIILCYVMLCIFFVRGAIGPEKSPRGAQDVLS
jgi:hypothetical protein